MPCLKKGSFCAPIVAATGDVQNALVKITDESSEKGLEDIEESNGGIRSKLQECVSHVRKQLPKIL
jgi:hypothetical protein